MARFTVANRTDLLTQAGVSIGDIGTVSSEGLDYEWTSGDQANLENWVLVDGSDTRKFTGGLPVAVGFDMQTNRPLDERDVVLLLDDLKTMPNAYQYIEVKVAEYNGIKYRWNGLDQTNLNNWKPAEDMDAVTGLQIQIDNNSDAIVVNSGNIAQNVIDIAQNTADILLKEDKANKGSLNGYAELDGTGRVPVNQLPDALDDVLEYPTLGDFPVTGVDGIIYIAIDANKTYRWGGTVYVEIGGGGVALGETSTTAYRGDRGKIAYDFSQAFSDANYAKKDSLNTFVLDQTFKADVVPFVAGVSSLGLSGKRWTGVFGDIGNFADGNVILGQDNSNAIVVDSPINGNFFIKFKTDNTSKFGGLAYEDNDGSARFSFIFNDNKVILSNRASNGTVHIKANDATAGAGGEFDVMDAAFDGVDVLVPMTVYNEIIVSPDGSSNSNIRLTGNNPIIYGSPTGKSKIDLYNGAGGINFHTLNGTAQGYYYGKLIVTGDFRTQGSFLMDAGQTIGGANGSYIKLYEGGRGGMEFQKSSLTNGWYQFLATDGVTSLLKIQDDGTTSIGGDVDAPNLAYSTTTGEPTGADRVGNFVTLTQAEYDAGTPVSTTTYIIVG